MKIPGNGVLLIGPTGCGKTPLGELIAAEGLCGRRAAHFDFGEHLRRAAAGPADYPLLSSEEISVISSSLETGALLTDAQFGIAEKLLLSFVNANGLAASDWLVLNGMPRHTEQAARVREALRMALIVSLLCDDDTVLSRIATNAGGDRTGRVDDARLAVLKKLAVFKKQTEPLIGYFEAQQVPIERITVSLTTSPRHILEQLNSALSRHRLQ